MPWRSSRSYLREHAHSLEYLLKRGKGGGRRIVLRPGPGLEVTAWSKANKRNGTRLLAESKDPVGQNRNKQLSVVETARRKMEPCRGSCKVDGLWMRAGASVSGWRLGRGMNEATALAAVNLACLFITWIVPLFFEPTSSHEGQLLNISIIPVFQALRKFCIAWKPNSPNGRRNKPSTYVKASSKRRSWRSRNTSCKQDTYGLSWTILVK